MATIAWAALFRRPGSLKGADHTLKDPSRNRVTWGECELLQAADPREAPSGSGGDLSVHPLPLSSRSSASPSARVGYDMVNDVIPSTKTAGLPRNPAVPLDRSGGFWIADAGCGYGLLSKRWVDLVNLGRLTRIDKPPTFAGVGGSMAANMKLLMQSSALKSAIEPYVLPTTSDVISIGNRCVEMGW